MMIITNVFAYRSTNPKMLWAVKDPVGPENDAAILRVMLHCDSVVVGWGSIGAAFPTRIQVVRSILEKKGQDIMCLGTTKGMAPRHPLYLANDTKLIPWMRYSLP